ncbi:PTS glucose transporter subunit IIA [Weissella viridescens]|uniref:PTS glucose transporter subunit IIA n=1 Tax=Weissella viridescens TaxID=1629 RepID=A0A3P2RJ34_WEIVI|nr:glucose PTS transporter subunit IIA [Weissella viridescens]RRG18760.1 PTS glucose transporter subunit IIA [Weissella viridescens]
MFGFKKKRELIDDQRIFAVASGELIPLRAVDDPVFSQGMMGRGYGLNPVENAVVQAPVFAKVTLVQGHAIGLERADNLQYLIHIGIDTVNLSGKPFKPLVAEGDIVEVGDELVKVDWNEITNHDLAKTVMVVMPNEQKLGATVQIDDQVRNVTTGEEVGFATR